MPAIVNVVEPVMPVAFLGKADVPYRKTVEMSYEYHEESFVVS